MFISGLETLHVTYDGATQTTNGPVTNHACSAEGSFRATLTVTDNDGQSSLAEVFVEVTGPPVFGGGNIRIRRK